MAVGELIIILGIFCFLGGGGLAAAALAFFLVRRSRPGDDISDGRP